MRRWLKHGAGLAVGVLVVSGCTSTHRLSTSTSTSTGRASSSSHPKTTDALSTTTTGSTPASTASPATTAAAPSTTTSSTAPPSAAANAALASKLLTAADLDADGDQWTPIPASTTATTTGCFAGFQATPDQARAVAGFGDGGDLPAVYEVLAVPISPAAQVFDAANHAYAACTNPTVVDRGRSYTGTMGSIDIDPEGDQSAAYEVDLTVGDDDVVYDIVLVRKGGTLMGIQLVDLDDVDPDQLQDITEQALAKLG